jgi:cytochrome P450
LAPNYLITLAAVDLTDLDMWARAVPYGEFGRLRREAPVAWSADEVSGFWPVSRYADIVAASRDVATFSVLAAAVAVYEHFITGLTADVLDRMPPPGEAFDFVDAVAKEAHRVHVRPDPDPDPAP